MEAEVHFRADARLTVQVPQRQEPLQPHHPRLPLHEAADKRRTPPASNPATSNTPPTPRRLEPHHTTPTINIIQHRLHNPRILILLPLSPKLQRRHRVLDRIMRLLLNTLLRKKEEQQVSLRTF